MLNLNCHLIRRGSLSGGRSLASHSLARLRGEEANRQQRRNVSWSEDDSTKVARPLAGRGQETETKKQSRSFRTNGARVNGCTSVLDSKPTHKEAHKDRKHNPPAHQIQCFLLARDFILAALPFRGAWDSFWPKSDPPRQPLLHRDNRCLSAPAVIKVKEGKRRLPNSYDNACSRRIASSAILDCSLFRTAPAV